MRVFYLIGLLLIGLHAPGPMIHLTGTSVPALSGTKINPNEVCIDLDVMLAHLKALLNYYQKSGKKYLDGLGFTSVLYDLVDTYKQHGDKLPKRDGVALNIVSTYKESIIIRPSSIDANGVFLSLSDCANGAVIVK